MRKKIIAGNWKMHKTGGEAVILAKEIKRLLADFDEVEVVLCPPFTTLKLVGGLLSGTRLVLGAQNMSSEDEGAYTGEICHTMLRELAVRYVILGHSERRAYYRETDFWINKKVFKALEKGLRPILCVGETLEDREAGRTENVVETQVREGLKGAAAEIFSELVIAYEPVWAIGTGKTATAEQAQEAHAFIRGLVRAMTGEAAAEAVRIQYGGSMNPTNAAGLLKQPDIDGGLIGGASLNAAAFATIVKAAREVQKELI